MEINIFTDKSIIEQKVCTIQDGEDIGNREDGISIVVVTREGINSVEVLLPKSELIKAIDLCEEQCGGSDKLWAWFGLSYASFLTLPRVLMHEMPDDWQGKMADLLYEYYEEFPNQPDLGTIVQATKNGKITKMPEYLKNYRHPDLDEIDKMR